ncbi:MULTISPECIES: diadenylate cyclase CdaA [Carnobacterium]|uniref:Diadenylate cyclase n=1 Tax=Carnobacterium antarcticum TaxID=2126436 RepID=A0ABW4NNQ5_9LACT|nr:MULTISPECIES: diadenylate cyclase CdaA [unclassified Carnobacterium]ALV22612.1 Diadenylate cyclase spyDAC Bacterial checkpoint controller DisA with nucleotide-binding domain [Carnobacterium sp. CP1]QQP70519.1 TIGR00159 family protein [Carnobacterium sp. CS13]
MSIDWSHLFTWRTFINAVDIMVVTFFIYQLIKILKGTKAVQLLKGIAVIMLIKIGSFFLQLQTVDWIVDLVIQWSVLAIIIIFQPELRRGLEHLGRGSFFKNNQRKIDPAKKMIQQIDQAVQYMAKRRIGALISIQMETGLEEYISTGIALDADISGELLINIFIPNTPLHDGAVIIKNHKIAAAAGYLPLSESSLIPKDLGTRHRAAIGLSEVTDAITVIVSEETGGVSISHRGDLLRELSREDFVKFLSKELVLPEEAVKKNPLQEFIDSFKKGV